MHNLIRTRTRCMTIMRRPIISRLSGNDKHSGKYDWPMNRLPRAAASYKLFAHARQFQKYQGSCRTIILEYTVLISQLYCTEIVAKDRGAIVIQA